MPILTVSLNKRMRIIQSLYILSLEIMVHACSFKYLRETSHSSMKKGKWSPNSWREIKHLWNPSHGKWRQNCMQEEMHAEHCTASCAIRQDVILIFQYGGNSFCRKTTEIQICLVLTSEYKFLQCVAVEATPEFQWALISQLMLWLWYLYLF